MGMLWQIFEKNEHHNLMDVVILEEIKTDLEV
jgi:hypothetical protein